MIIKQSIFTTIASDLAQKLTVTAGNYGEPEVKKNYGARGIREDHFSLTHTTITANSNILRDSDTNRATDLDTAAAKFLREY